MTPSVKDERLQRSALILFDGVCVFCSRSVRLISSKLEKGTVTFIPMQTERGQELLKSFDFPLTDFKTFVYIDDDEVLVKSAAGIRILKRMNFPWPILATILKFIPKTILDRAYNCLAHNRYRILGKTKQCYIP